MVERDASREATVGRAVHRSRHIRTVHRVLRLRHLVPLRRPGVRRHPRRLQTLPRRCRGWSGQLHPRPEGLHALHEGVPPLPDLGARDRDLPLRAATHRRRGLRHRAPDRAGPGHLRRRAGGGPRRRIRLGSAGLGLRPRPDRRRAGLGTRGGRLDVEGGAPGRLEPRRRARHGGVAVHLLGESPRLPGSHRRGRRTRRARWGWGARPRRLL